MDKQLIKMMGKMMEQMNDMQSDIKNIKTDMNVMQSDIKNIKTDMNVMQSDMKNMKTDMNVMQSDMKNMKTDMKNMKTEMNMRFDAVDAKLKGVGHQFVELSKNTTELREDMQKELKYVTYKIHALDREVFLRTDPPQ